MQNIIIKQIIDWTFRFIRVISLTSYERNKLRGNKLKRKQIKINLDFLKKE